jgi:hypothetical protein
MKQKKPQINSLGRLQKQGLMAACHYSAHVLVRPQLLRTVLARNTEITSRGRVAGSLLQYAAGACRLGVLPAFERSTSHRHATVGRAGRLSRLEISGLPRPA